MKFLRPSIFIFIESFFSIYIFAQVTISGNAPTYAGKEIVFKTFADPFTGDEKKIGTSKVGPDGDFSIVLPVDKTTYIFSHLGIFKGSMFVEPEKSYFILFPERKDKTQADLLNPFFEEVEFQFAVRNIQDNDLNFIVHSFNDAYSPYFRKFAGNIYSKNNKAIVDSTINKLKNINPGTNNLFYKSYIDYRFGYLKHLAYQQKSKSISKELFQTKPILYDNPAYMELFNQVYNKYFYFFGKTNYGKKIFDDINTKKSYYLLSLNLKSDTIFTNDSLLELVVLKNIHDEFYSNNFSRSGLLAILDSLEAKTKIEKHKEIALLIHNKITRLMPGYPPPPFELFDQEGKLVKLSDFLGKYVYINFCSCSSYACIKEFDLLKQLKAKYKDKFQIVTIATDDSRETMTWFVSKNEFNWIFLHFANQPDILKDYDIRAYPTYFLIGPDGKLIYSPAASPSENFELFLFQAMRARGDA
jgi:peroxiredoxin